MHQELVSLGETFKQKRGELGLTLKEIENSTSIRHSYLEAIEEGQVGKLISPVYAQGFIKKYATFLELDGDALLREHPYVQKILSESRSSQGELPFGLGSIEVRGSPGREIKWLPNLLWVGLSVLVILGGWFLARHFGIF